MVVSKPYGELVEYGRINVILGETLASPLMQVGYTPDTSAERENELRSTRVSVEIWDPAVWGPRHKGLCRRQ